MTFESERGESLRETQDFFFHWFRWETNLDLLRVRQRSRTPSIQRWPVLRVVASFVNRSITRHSRDPPLFPVRLTSSTPPTVTHLRCIRPLLLYALPACVSSGYINRIFERARDSSFLLLGLLGWLIFRFFRKIFYFTGNDMIYYNRIYIRNKYLFNSNGYLVNSYTWI